MGFNFDDHSVSQQKSVKYSWNKFCIKCGQFGYRFHYLVETSYHYQLTLQQSSYLSKQTSFIANPSKTSPTTLQGHDELG